MRVDGGVVLALTRDDEMKHETKIHNPPKGKDCLKLSLLSTYLVPLANTYSTTYVGRCVWTEEGGTLTHQHVSSPTKNGHVIQKIGSRVTSPSCLTRTKIQTHYFSAQKRSSSHKSLAPLYLHTTES